MKRNILTVPIGKVENNSAAPAQDLLAVEEPLQIRIGERDIAITMRTPGNDAELAAGFLFSEGILHSATQIASVVEDQRNRITLHLVDGDVAGFEAPERNFYMTSSCGVCGRASIDALTDAGCPYLERSRPRLDATIIHTLPDILRSTQAVFDLTGGLHAAGLFDTTGTLLNVREDVGRHNAVDKLLGAAFLAGQVPLNDHILMVSGRASFELVQKALMAGVPILAAVGAPSSLAVQTALRFGMTLLGFVRNQRFNVYCGEQRLLF